ELSPFGMPALHTASMTLHNAFLLDILEHPDDDTPRLVYADWLMERGEPRGEFIRIQVERARLERDDPRWEPLWKRECELLAEYKLDWIAAVHAELVPLEEHVVF